MSKQPTLTTISSGYYSTTALNSNYTAIQTAFNNTLSLDGSTPNTMTADLDLGSQDLLNGNYLYGQRLYLNGVRVTSPDANITWLGEWVTSTSYVVDQLVRDTGNVYICLEDHTSGTFSTDLAANKWELFASKGSAGAGTGDLLAANNLSDLANSDTALANLGGGTVGIAIFKDTTAAAVRAEISAQQQDDILDDLAGLTQATNKIPYFDSATTASTLTLETTLTDDDTKVPSSGAVVDALPFSESFTSSEQTISAGSTLTLAHSLSSTPILVQAVLVCKTAQSPYAIGDNLVVASSLDNHSGVGYKGVTYHSNGTNVIVQVGLNGIEGMTTSGNNLNLTLSNWKLVARAWA